MAHCQWHWGVVMAQFGSELEMAQWGLEMVRFASDIAQLGSKMVDFGSEMV